MPLDPDDPAPRRFQASASDAAGNTGFSDIHTFIPGIQSGDLIPLDPDGQPAGDSLVAQKPDGTLTREGIRGGMFALTRPALGLPGNFGGSPRCPPLSQT